MTSIKMRLLWLCLFIALGLLPASLRATNFVFTNDNVYSPSNSVTVFRVNPTTYALIKVGTYPTGGMGWSNGGYLASNRIVTSPNGNYVFAHNAGDNTVSVLRVNKATGALTPISGSPFSTLGNGLFGASLAITPNGDFLFIAHTYSETITRFSVAANGRLTYLGSTDLTNFGSVLDGTKVRPDGKFLAVALFNRSKGKVAMFSIGHEGALAAVPGSPFPVAGVGPVAGLDFECGCNLLFAGESDLPQTAVDVFSVGKKGALTEVLGSPFVFGGIESDVVLYSAFGRLLFVSNQVTDSIWALKVDSSGVLTPGPNSPVPVGTFFYRVGMASNSLVNPHTHETVHLLYVAMLNNGVAVFTVAEDGTLTEVAGSPFPTGVSGGLMSIAVTPGGYCGGPIDRGEFLPGQTRNEDEPCVEAHDVCR